MVNFFVKHQIECHLGTQKKLIINYNTKSHGAKEIANWPRWVGIDKLDQRKFTPDRDETMGCLVFIPRLELVFIENDNLYCIFMGGDDMKGSWFHSGSIDIRHPPLLNWSKIGTVEKINPNRVILRLDSTAFALENFILHKKVLI